MLSTKLVYLFNCQQYMNYLPDVVTFRYEDHAVWWIRCATNRMPRLIWFGNRAYRVAQTSHQPISLPLIRLEADRRHNNHIAHSISNLSLSPILSELNFNINQLCWRWWAYWAHCWSGCMYTGHGQPFLILTTLVVARYCVKFISIRREWSRYVNLYD